MSVHDGTVGEDEGLILKFRPENVKSGSGSHDLHVRRGSQWAMWIPGEERVTPV
jgi:hypothetical protein